MFLLLEVFLRYWLRVAEGRSQENIVDTQYTQKVKEEWNDDGGMEKGIF